MKYILSLLALCSSAAAGEFVVTCEDTAGIWFEYTGYVEDYDAETLHDLMVGAGSKQVFIVINSGGGSAYGGLDLFWEAERWQNLTTIAGEDYGAWSAAAVFWLGSPRDWFEGEEAKVGFHSAYCDPWNPPGCDTSLFQIQLIEVLERCHLSGDIFNHYLNQLQEVWGVSGWALLTDEGWFFHESHFNLTDKITPTWTY